MLAEFRPTRRSPEGRVAELPTMASSNHQLGPIPAKLIPPAANKFTDSTSKAMAGTACGICPCLVQGCRAATIATAAGKPSRNSIGSGGMPKTNPVHHPNTTPANRAEVHSSKHPRRRSLVRRPNSRTAR